MNGDRRKMMKAITKGAYDTKKRKEKKTVNSKIIKSKSHLFALG